MTEPAKRTTSTKRKPTTNGETGSGDNAPELLARQDSAPDRTTRALMAKLPIYQRIAAELRAQIESGQLAAGAAIPSETEMIAQYGVSRITIRHAIAALRTSGLITTEHGRASRVRATIATADAGALEFDPTITRDGHTFRTWDAEGWADVEEPSRYRTGAGRHAQTLNLAPAEPVFVLDRHLLHTSGTQIMHRTYVPFATAADLDSDPFETATGLYAVLAKNGHDLSWRDSNSAAMPSPEEALTLSIPEGVPMIIHRRTTLAAGVPMILEEVLLPADRASIVSNPTPARSASLAVKS